METVNWVSVAINLLLACGQLYVLWILRGHSVREKNLERTVEEIFRAVNQVDYHGSIPPVAVERFMGYIKHSDPSFDAAAIIQQEINNQLGGPMGGALPKGVVQYPDGGVKLNPTNKASR